MRIAIRQYGAHKTFKIQVTNVGKRMQGISKKVVVITV